MSANSFFFSVLSRLFGLKDIIIPGNCSLSDDLSLNANHDWPVYVNPGILFVLYITVAAVLKTGSHAKADQVSAGESASSPWLNPALLSS